MKPPPFAVSRALGLLVALTSAVSHAGSPYHTAEELNSRLRELAAAHPKIAQTHKIATTLEGREILALEIDADGILAPDDRVLLVHGGIHGNEWGSVEVVLHLAELVIAVPELMGSLRLHFVPLINVDGFDTEKRKVLDPAGVLFDPNREFPVPTKGPKSSRAPIDAFRHYAKRGSLAGVLDYHNPAECFLWPYAYSESQEPKRVNALKEVVEDMARSVGYCFGQTAHVISYKHEGTAQDYFAYEHDVPAVLMELGWMNGPEHDFLPEEVIEQERPFRIFLTWLQAQIQTGT